MCNSACVSALTDYSSVIATHRRTQVTYLTEKRLASLKQYLDDVAAGMDTVAAWKLHKARVAA